MSNPDLDNIFTSIARRYLKLQTLDVSGNNGQDISRHHVRSIKRALRAAYEVGNAGQTRTWAQPFTNEIVRVDGAVIIPVADITYDAIDRARLPGESFGDCISRKIAEQKQAGDIK